MRLLWLLAACRDETPAPAAAPARVAVAVAERGTLDAAFTTLGEVFALDDATLAAEASATVVRVGPREGDSVRAGEVLVVLDDAVAAAELQAADAAEAEAEAVRDLAAKVLERTARVREGVLAPLEREEAEAELLIAEARALAARAARARAGAVRATHRVVAPFDGVVAERRVSPGDYVRMGDPVLRLVASGAVEVHLDVGRALVGRLPVGTPATIAGATAGFHVVGAVPALDPDARTARVRLAPDGDAGLVPGATVDVAFSVAAAPEGVVVPRDALVLSAGDPRVVRVVDGAAVPTVVTVLATAGDRVMLGSGVSAGEVVVVRGNERLAPGAPLEIAP